MALSLTKNGVPFLLQTQNRINQNILVQVINLKGVKNGKHYPCHISDGFRKIKSAITTTNQKFSADHHNFALIKIKQHSIIKVGQIIRGVEIQQFQIEGPYPELIGDPVNYSEEAEISEHANNYIDIDKMKAKNAKKKPIEIFDSEKKKAPIILDIEEEEDITERRLKDSDKISDLYADLANWQIICRITDMNYKQFISKKSNKFTQILTLELIDRTGMKIEGTIFGQYAKQLKQKLSLNGLYRISKGQIRQENYSTNKGPKYSRYNINFNASSVFLPLHDTTLIPQFDQNAYYSVQQVVAQKDFDKQYDIVGIITEAGQEKELTDKNGKAFTKRVISVSDPQNNQTIEVTLWRDVKFDEGLKGKTALLKNFKLNSYMNNVTLNSLFKSQIKGLDQHRYRKYENGLNPNEFKHVSQAPQVDHSGDCRTIKKLQNQIQYMEGQTIYSNLNAYVSLISFKGKWFYESCPKCKRGGAEPNSTCCHCQNLIQEPISRFILPIQIADFTGSIWTTSFDQFSSVLLQGKQINDLKKYDDVRLREEGERRIFQQFRFRISTKRQLSGSIKHTIIGKPVQICFEKVALQNINRIYEYE